MYHIFNHIIKSYTQSSNIFLPSITFFSPSSAIVELTIPLIILHFLNKTSTRIYCLRIYLTSDIHSLYKLPNIKGKKKEYKPNIKYSSNRNLYTEWTSIFSFILLFLNIPPTQCK